jgi:hypothetical protein
MYGRWLCVSRYMQSAVLSSKQRLLQAVAADSDALTIQGLRGDCQSLTGRNKREYEYECDPALLLNHFSQQTVVKTLAVTCTSNLDEGFSYTCGNRTQLQHTRRNESMVQRKAKDVSTTHHSVAGRQLSGFLEAIG